MNKAPLAADWPLQPARLQPVPATEVRASGFLGEHIARNREAIFKALDNVLLLGFKAKSEGREIPKAAIRLAADSDV